MSIQLGVGGNRDCQVLRRLRSCNWRKRRIFVRFQKENHSFQPTENQDSHNHCFPVYINVCLLLAAIYEDSTAISSQFRWSYRHLPFSSSAFFLFFVILVEHSRLHIVETSRHAHQQSLQHLLLGVGSARKGNNDICREDSEWLVEFRKERNPVLSVRN